MDSSEKFFCLSRDIFFEIFSHLSGRDLNRVARVCKIWKEQVKADALWKRVLMKEFPLYTARDGASYKTQWTILTSIIMEFPKEFIEIIGMKKLCSFPFLESGEDREKAYPVCICTTLVAFDVFRIKIKDKKNKNFGTVSLRRNLMPSIWWNCQENMRIELSVTKGSFERIKEIMDNTHSYYKLADN